MATITFTAVIIRPRFDLPSHVVHSERRSSDYWLDGRQLYNNLYYCETATIGLDDAPTYARDFLRRKVVEYQRQENESDDNLCGHTLTWRWNGQHQADENYYPSGQYAECTWVQNGKVERVELDKFLLDIIEIDMMHQSDAFYYGKDTANRNYHKRLSEKGVAALDY